MTVEATFRSLVSAVANATALASIAVFAPPTKGEDAAAVASQQVKCCGAALREHRAAERQAWIAQSHLVQHAAI